MRARYALGSMPSTAFRTSVCTLSEVGGPEPVATRGSVCSPVRQTDFLADPFDGLLSGFVALAMSGRSSCVARDRRASGSIPPYRNVQEPLLIRSGWIGTTEAAS
jgi:hypothetical protein